MYLYDIQMREQQKATLPPGYELITTGNLQPGDLRWNVLDDCWNLVPTTSPRHDLILGDPVLNFHGVCRKLDSQPSENRIFENQQTINTDYSIVQL